MNKILIVGRTNVGKSSLFNALIGQRLSIVADTENLTKDVIRFSDQNFTIFDSPGIANEDELDAILGKTGEIDKVCIVRQNYNKLCEIERMIMNKLGSAQHIIIINGAEQGLAQFSQLEYIPVCIKTRLNIDVLRRRLGLIDVKTSRANRVMVNKDTLPRTIGSVPGTRIGSVSDNQDQKQGNNNRKWSIFGRANVGKSSLANLLLGQDRFCVKNEIGTTLEVHSDIKDDLEIADTPGFRKNNALPSIDKASQYRLKDYMYSGGNGIVVLDGHSGLTKLDRSIIDKLLDSFRLIIVLNKVDLVDKERILEIKQELARLYPNLPVINMSCERGIGLTKLRYTMRILERDTDIKTSALNKVLHENIKLSKIKYMTRKDDRTFLLFTKSDLSQAEIRYVEKTIASKFKLLGDRLKLEVRRS